MDAKIDRVSKDGKFYKAEVVIDFDPDLVNINKILSKHFEAEDTSENYGFDYDSPHMGVSGYSNAKGEGPKNYTPELFNWLAKQSVKLRVKVGNISKTFYVAYHYDRNGDCGHDSVFGDEVMGYEKGGFSGEYCIVEMTPQSDTEIPQAFGDDFESNPFIFKLTKKQAANANQVTAKVIYDGTQ